MAKFLLLLSCQGLYYILSYTFVWVLAKSIPPDRLGTYFLSFAFANGISIFVKWGWGQATLRYCSKLSIHCNSSAFKFLGYAASRIAIRSIAGFGVCAIFALLITTIYSNKLFLPLMLLLSPYIVLHPFNEITIQYLRILGRVKLFSVLQYLTAPLTKISIFLFFFLLFDLEIFAIPLGVILSEFIVLLVGYLFLTKGLFKILFKDKPDDESRIKIFSKNIGINLMLIFMLNGGDIAFAGLWLKPEEIAGYQISRQVSNIILMSLALFEPVVAPAFAKLIGGKDKAGLQESYNLSVKFLSVIAIGMTCALLFNAEWLLNLFGRYYASAILPIIILCVCQMINVFTGQCGYILSMAGYSKIILTNGILTAVSTLLLIAVLVPYYRVNGLAVAVGCSIILVNLLRVYQIRKFENIRWLSSRQMIHLSAWLILSVFLFGGLKLFLPTQLALAFGLSGYYGAALTWHLFWKRDDLHRFLNIIFSNDHYKN
jgi:O-antigen/teichoic acid export membrane protein